MSRIYGSHPDNLQPLIGLSELPAADRQSFVHSQCKELIEFLRDAHHFVDLRTRNETDGRTGDVVERWQEIGRNAENLHLLVKYSIEQGASTTQTLKELIGATNLSELEQFKIDVEKIRTHALLLISLQELASQSFFCSLESETIEQYRGLVKISTMKVDAILREYFHQGKTGLDPSNDQPSDKNNGAA